MTADTLPPGSPEGPADGEAGDPLADLLARAERAEWPPPDGSIRVLSQPPGRAAAVVAFTAHTVVAADVTQEWVHAVLDRDDIFDLGAPMRPAFLSALAERTGRRIGALDQMMLAGPLPGPPPLELTELTDSGHPRVRRAHRYRDDVRVYAADGGLVLVGRGLAGRWELAFEVEPGRQGRGLGRVLARAARHLLPPAARAVWAQVSPGNAASVRTLLAAGYRPVGAEVLLVAP
ncbi:GNAT family N-acetyltransferase [Actinopolymorpha singaporensis]|uniref:Acetyltransferase (GNAT) family protein n=1 Tax=Actinopolymorpha singaporensis TaxID=117157 RepID=A0A1H1WAC3_9ACTN|nr:GNAT family N-acetyltransferase [Actinopolymorpha singaporensis]SDS94278.1 Acetyltransferase (GNAT) family protein [Actinopolymorpha singaporensis]